MPPIHVLIIGAGLGGPALALALARQRIRSTIFERRPTSQDIGGVLMLAPNAIRVLDQIVGIESVVRKLGFTFSTIDVYWDYGKSMEKLGGIGITQSSGSKDSMGYDGLTIKRPVLHNTLLELCEEQDLISVKFGKRLHSIDEDAEGVTARFDDGTSATGDILLGVDGIHSSVRSHVLKDHPVTPQYSGHVVLGGSIARSAIPPVTLPGFFYTQAGTILAFPTDPSGDTLQWATFLSAPERDRKSWDEYRTSGEGVKELRREWAGITAEPARSFIDSATNENLMVWAPYQIPELHTWHTDRVCLLGDASHAISPSAGQGTAQALEDVGLMARLLASPAVDKGYPALFGHYETARRERMEYIKKFTERSMANRGPTTNAWTWWAKRMACKALFTFVASAGRLRDNTAIGYDVTKENIVI